MTMDNHQHLKDLAEIRSLMERSSRFISLSGLSGVAAGLFALLGAAAVYIYLGIMPFDGNLYKDFDVLRLTEHREGLLKFLLLDALIVLVLAVASGIFFTTRKAIKKGQKIWDKLTLRLLLNLAIPLVVGAVFCLALMKYELFGLVAPTTLIFYGLALINGSHYTLQDIRYLGISEIVLGTISLFNIGYGLECWALGFGVLHIVYGAIMWNKYERK